MAGLELGPAKAADFTKHTGINRGTVYDIIKALFRKGLMSSTQKGNTTYFVTLSPERFIQKLEEQTRKAERMLPEIKTLLSTSSNRPKIRFFEGTEGLKAIYDETLQCKSKDLIQFVSVEEMLASVGLDFMQYYITKRARRHIQLRAINDPKGEIDDTKVGYSSHTDVSLLREARIAPNGVSFPSMMMVYDNSVALISTKKENFGFIIDSVEYAHMMRSLFEVLWGISK